MHKEAVSEPELLRRMIIFVTIKFMRQGGRVGGRARDFGSDALCQNKGMEREEGADGSAIK